MPRYFTEKISEEGLAKKIFEAGLGSTEKYPDYFEFFTKKATGQLGKEMTRMQEENLYLSFSRRYGHLSIHYQGLTKRVYDDLSKVEFSADDYSASPDGSWGGEGRENLGIHTLESGLTYCGVISGGDEEDPLFYIVYWDGKELRGYVPTDGNPWNTETNKAYGNDEREDEDWGARDKQNMIDRGFLTEEDFRKFKTGEIKMLGTKPDFQNIFKDINERILYKGK